jgi:BirA family transcriptional regulator, biotin operon repressor / biotin---[acetyl-CoA-carboxylase] ligase
MDRAAELARAGAPEGLLVVAERQTAGRGRLERTWESPPGGLWFSLLLRPTLPLSQIGLVGIAFALAAAETIRENAGIKIGVKWPNDLIYEGRKLAGLLLETRLRENKLDCVIFGMGINLNVPLEAFPAELQASAISLLAATGQTFSAPDLLSHFLHKAEDSYNKLQAGDCDWLFVQWPEFDLCRGKEVIVIQGENSLTGRAAGIDDTGALRVETASGLITVNSGEVAWR